MSDRIVELVAVSDTRNPSEIASRLDIPPDRSKCRGEIPSDSIGKKPAPQHVWLIEATGHGGVPFDSLIDSVLSRVRRGMRDMRALAESECQFVFRIVAYLSTADAVTPGFSLDEQWVALLAAINASIDVDLYVVDSAG